MEVATILLLLAGLVLAVCIIAAILKLFAIARYLQQIVVLLQIQTRTQTGDLEAAIERKHGGESSFMTQLGVATKSGN